ncbi:dynein light chain [Monocercomonoides exilis]|uniref:dynein light chain n=1 Tax=Monocercomonoides exilis TaxID=2049356 RepID=UPI00355A4881|nr:dynein light chain [Monocercomonoides exilis]|eukprot:MONOS_324.1-p1 / transcript=MONOS_324.1 / gene=MONOS_324 / organism=Monocercomonoides_exilis_PA203 / gene_product=dynein light chain / transcript_product=dynein light chain / location=Mono_scaffold00005:156968-157423(-) / protein_length=126 / sequence_SO=supercontig / SO=protein_coding / is_pseudo=false
MQLNILSTDMSPDHMQGLKTLSKEFYDRILLQAKDQYLNKGFERVVAKWFKEGFDHQFGPAWHCIAGPEFAAFVTHEAKSLAYFNLQYSPPPKKASHTQGQQEDEFEKKKEAQPIAFWRILLFKAG